MEWLSFKEFRQRLNQLEFSDFDLIVAIARGGIIPGAILQQKLRIPMEILRIEYRDDDHKPKHAEPVIKSKLMVRGKNILLVDDVIRSGKTIKAAKEHLKGNAVSTFAVNGNADYFVRNQEECFRMPWSIEG